MNAIFTDMNASLTAASREWGWFLVLGILTILLGVAAIYYEGAATIASVVALGAILIVAGILQLAMMFRAHGAGHVLLYLVLGVLDIVVGLAIIEHPGAGALLVTLFVAVYLVFSGIYRAIMALWTQFPQYGWAAFAGVISAILGVLLWAEWPVSATWFIGFALGINFILLGAAYCAFALQLRQTTQGVTP